MLENERLRQQLEQTQEKLSIAAGDLKETTEKYEGIREEYEKGQNEIERLEKEMDASRALLTDTSVLRGKLEGEIAVLKEKIRSLTGNGEHLEGRRQTLEGEISSRQKEKEALLTKKAGIEAEFSKQQANRDQASQTLESTRERIAELNSSVESGKNAIIEILNQRAAIKSRVGRLDTMTEQLQIRRAQLNSRLLRAKSDEVEQEETIRTLEAAFEEVNREIAERNEGQSRMEEQLSALRNDLAQKDKQLRILR